jgi:hypothetical protein
MTNSNNIMARFEKLGSDECEGVTADDIIADMTPAERAEFDAYCDAKGTEAVAHQMMHDDSEIPF